MMTIEFLHHFYRATDPGKPLFAQDPEDQKLYIDFSEVRGGQIIEELKDNIIFFSPDSKKLAKECGIQNILGFQLNSQSEEVKVLCRGGFHHYLLFAHPDANKPAPTEV